MKHIIRILLGVAVITGFVAPVGALAFSSGPAMAGPWGKAPVPYTCTGGDFASFNFVPIPSGNYSSITVKGACQTVPGAVINVTGNVSVAAGAALDAQSFPSTITVGHDVLAGPGSLLGLGCLPDPVGHTTGHPCTDPQTGNPSETAGSSNITVNGNVLAWAASAILLNGITVKGNVTLIGSEGTDSVAARATAIPWSIKTNTIGGNLLIAGATPIWFGVIINKVGGNVILLNDHITDGLPPNNDPAPTIFVASNQVGQNLICFGLGPAVSGGFSGEVNVVGGHALGQCANLTTFSPSASS